MEKTQNFLDRAAVPDARIRNRMRDWAENTFRETASELEHYADTFSANERHALRVIMKQCHALLRTL